MLPMYLWVVLYVLLMLLIEQEAGRLFLHDAGPEHLNWVRICWEGRRSTADPLLLCQCSWRMKTDSFGLDHILLGCATVAVPPWLHLPFTGCVNATAHGRRPRMAPGFTECCLSSQLSSVLKYNKQ